MARSGEKENYKKKNWVKIEERLFLVHSPNSTLKDQPVLSIMLDAPLNNTDTIPILAPIQTKNITETREV